MQWALLIPGLSICGFQYPLLEGPGSPPECDFLSVMGSYFQLCPESPLRPSSCGFNYLWNSVSAVVVVLDGSPVDTEGIFPKRFTDIPKEDDPEKWCSFSDCEKVIAASVSGWSPFLCFVSKKFARK